MEAPQPRLKTLANRGSLGIQHQVGCGMKEFIMGGSSSHLWEMKKYKREVEGLETTKVRESKLAGKSDS